MAMSGLYRAADRESVGPRRERSLVSGA